MFGLVSNMREEDGKRRFLQYTSVLETTITYDGPATYPMMVENAAKIRNMVRGNEVLLNQKEINLVLGMITKAKVKAFMDGTPDSYQTFKTLDTISNDLVRLL